MVAIPLDGRLTSQNVLDIALTGGEVLYIVSPGNAALGNSYQVTLSVIADYIVDLVQIPVVQLVTMSGSHAVAAETTALIYRKAFQSNSPFLLPPGVDGKVIEISDETGLAGDMTATPDGADKIMGVNGPMIVASSGGIPQSGGHAIMKFYSAISGWQVF